MHLAAAIVFSIFSVYFLQSVFSKKSKFVVIAMYFEGIVLAIAAGILWGGLFQ